MDTAEMRLLTVPQFARRVDRSVDEVLTLIASRDIKALRPDPEGGYRVLETEVDRLLQEKTTRIKRPADRAEGAPRNPSTLEPPTLPRLPQKHTPELEPTPARTVALETHLTAVTALEAARAENGRLERLNSNLQAELFKYRRLCEEDKAELHELRARLDAANQGIAAAKLEKIEFERQRVEYEQTVNRRLQAELEAAQRAEAETKRGKRSFWQRLFG
jgi:hypothetical protein